MLFNRNRVPWRTALRLQNAPERETAVDHEAYARDDGCNLDGGKGVKEQQNAKR